VGERGVEARDTNPCFLASGGRRTTAADKLRLPTSGYIRCGAGWGHWSQTHTPAEVQLAPVTQPCSSPCFVPGWLQPGNSHPGTTERWGVTTEHRQTLRQTGISSLPHPFLLLSSSTQAGSCCFLFYLLKTMSWNFLRLGLFDLFVHTESEVRWVRQSMEIPMPHRTCHLEGKEWSSPGLSRPSPSLTHLLHQVQQERPKDT
jgi:hypothetical protein